MKEGIFGGLEREKTVKEIVGAIGDLKSFFNSPTQQYVLFYLCKSALSTVHEINHEINSLSSGLYRNSAATIKALIKAGYIKEVSGKYQITESGRALAQWIIENPENNNSGTA